MIRLGTTSRILGRSNLRTHDGRRAPGSASLGVGLLSLRDVFGYLRSQQIGCYRLHGELLPPELRADPEAAARAIERAGELLALLTEQAACIRLTIHAGLAAALAAGDETSFARAGAELAASALLLDALGAGAGPNAGAIVVHIGGEGADRPAAIERFCMRYERLSAGIRRHLVVEHDTTFPLADALLIHQRTGVPVVFDLLHHRLMDPEQIGVALARDLALATWSAQRRRPKVHLSSQRTEGFLQPERAGHARQILAPRPGQHADFIAPDDALALLAAPLAVPFDVMIEAKAGDLALLRLREDLGRRGGAQLAERAV